MSDPYNVRLSPSARRALLAAALCAGCTDAVAPVDVVVPIQIVAVPDLDTLRLADSLVLTIGSDTAVPLNVIWTVEPRGDSLVADTLVYRPAEAGTQFVRALAIFDGDRVGSDARRVVARVNLAPVVTIVRPEDFSAVPLGDTIVLVAGITDSDGDTIPAEARRWFRGDPDGDLGTPLGTGETLLFPADSAQTIRFWLMASDDAGAVGAAHYDSRIYDPVTPWRWRVAFPTGVSAISRHPWGLILLQMGTTTMALTDDGTVVWSVETQSSADVIVVGDDGGIYVPGSPVLVRLGLLKLNPDGSQAWLDLRRPVTGPAVLWDGNLAVLTQGLGNPPDSVRLLNPGGAQLWALALDSSEYLGSLAVGVDSTVYVTAPEIGPPGAASMAAVGADGTVRWHLYPTTTSGTSRAIGGRPVVPADDSTVLFRGDSLYAVRKDGSVRWSSPLWGVPAIAGGRAYVSAGNQLVALDLAGGQEAWRADLPGPAGTGPLATASGDILIASGSIVIAVAAATGVERWRHEMSFVVTAELLLTAAGDLLLADARGVVESVPFGSGPAASPWPMGWADERRTSRQRQP